MLSLRSQRKCCAVGPRTIPHQQREKKRKRDRQTIPSLHFRTSLHLSCMLAINLVLTKLQCCKVLCVWHFRKRGELKQCSLFLIKLTGQVAPSHPVQLSGFSSHAQLPMVFLDIVGCDQLCTESQFDCENQSDCKLWLLIVSCIFSASSVHSRILTAHNWPHVN